MFNLYFSFFLLETILGSELGKTFKTSAAIALLYLYKVLGVGVTSLQNKDKYTVTLSLIASNGILYISMSIG